MSRHRALDSPRAPWQPGTREALAAVGLDPGWVHEFVLRALSEELGPRWIDVTTAATVPVDEDARAEVHAHQGGVACGLLLLPVVLAEAAARFGLPVPVARLLVADGARVRRGEVLAELRGPARVLLTAERTALNIVRHLSGVATVAARWVEALEGTGARLLDTRATTPGLRPLERYAVRCGGGSNGRAGLYDAAHVTVAHTLAAGSVERALDGVRRRLPDVLVQIDVRTPLEAVEAVLAGARFVVCEGMTPEVLASAVRQVRAATPEPVEIAVSGVADLDRAGECAQAGVDHLYVDIVTQQAQMLDLAFVVA
ncbi:MAG TPA: carboxylating nicotinate-nucleotide diphosphorylase [Kineosporiaceae bacterium]